MEFFFILELPIYAEVPPAISIEKSTNGQNADTAPGPYILTGEPVTWTYEVTNTGNVTLTSITVTDDQGVQVNCPSSTLQEYESFLCTASGTAVVGQYTNIATVTATPPAGLPDISDTDPSHYFGVSQGDTDSDNLTDIEELQVYGTETNNPDTDNDGLNDGVEVNYWVTGWNTDPDNDGLINLLDSDSDNDGLYDGLEVEILGTNPALADGYIDNDGDGFSNAEEIQCGSDPVNPSSRCSRGLPWLMLLLD